MSGGFGSFGYLRGVPILESLNYIPDIKNYFPDDIFLKEMENSIKDAIT